MQRPKVQLQGRLPLRVILPWILSFALTLSPLMAQNASKREIKVVEIDRDEAIELHYHLLRPWSSSESIFAEKALSLFMALGPFAQAVMRNAIREEDLDYARQQLPSLVSLSLSEDQVQLVVELAAAFVAPNSIYDEEATEAARQAAIESVEPVTRSIAAGETIIRRGEIVHLKAKGMGG